MGMDGGCLLVAILRGERDVSCCGVRLVEGEVEIGFCIHKIGKHTYRDVRSRIPRCNKPKSRNHTSFLAAGI